MKMPDSLAKLVRISESASVAIADKVRFMERSGKRVIRLQTGDPDFSTPQEIVEAACSALRRGATHYSMSRGLLELRQAIAAKLLMDNRLDYDPQDEILVTHGGIHAVFISIAALVDAGDEVIILDPSWMPYAAAVSLSGAAPIRVASSASSGFQPQAERIRETITPKTRMLVINSPCNPTGIVLNEAELLELAELAIEHNLIVIADEVYEKIIFDAASNKSIAALKGMRERTITINSFSKTYAMTGWRIGYLAGPVSLVRQILKVSQYTITNLAPFVQMAAIIALTSESCKKYTEFMRKEYQNRRRIALETLEEVEHIKAVLPAGTFYLMLDVSSIGARSELVAADLLEKKLVATVPGIAYGACAEGFLRLSLTASEEDLRTALNRIRDFAGSGGGA
jgi:aspartate/methionine/tyrosine aminotransferase